MPLTKKGSEIMANMKKEYGPKKGKQVFYASENAGKIKGVHGGKSKTGKRPKVQGSRSSSSKKRGA